MHAKDPRDRLHASLARDRRRAAGALAGSPEWDAALAGVEAIEQELERLESPRGSNDIRFEGARGARLLPVGPLSLADLCTVRGTISGGGAAAEAVRSDAITLASRAAGRREFLRELERLMTRAGFVVEAGVGDWDVITFYAWDARPEPAP